MAHTFEAQGLTFTKSSRSDTDWTKQCVGVLVHTHPMEAHLADSVTEDILPDIPGRELLALLRTVR
jgi:hypothetical protein